MGKADMLQELKCELGLIFESFIDKNDLYENVLRLLTDKIPHYKTMYIYLVSETAFHYYKHAGEPLEGYKEKVDFGDGYLSMVAARGEMACEFVPSGQHIYIPFYDGHHLLGEIVIITTQFIDEDELKFLKYIQKMLSEVPN